MIKHLRLEIAKLRREQYGHSSERRARLIDQMELQLEELEAAATEDEIAAEKATKTTTVAGFERRRPARKPWVGPFLVRNANAKHYLIGSWACGKHALSNAPFLADPSESVQIH